MSIRDSLAGRYRVEANPLKTERRVELLAVLLTLLLLLWIVYGVTRYLTLSPPSPIAPTAESLAVADMPAATGEGAAQSNEIRSRPLFWQSRRPEALPEEDAAPDPGAAQQGDLANIQLLGTFGVGKSAGVIAVIKGKKQRVLVGGDLAGWTLKKVKPASAIVTGNGKTHELALKRVAVATNQAAKPPGQPARKAAKKAAKKPAERRTLR